MRTGVRCETESTGRPDGSPDGPIMTVDRMGIERSLATRREAAIPPPAPEGAPNPAGSRECKTVLEEALAELFERERRLLGFEGELVELRHAIKVLRRASGHEQELFDLFNEVVDLFNPPASDSWHPLDAIRAAAAFIEAQPCTCPPEAGPPDYVEDPCERCRILGRIHDQPQTR